MSLKLTFEQDRTTQIELIGEEKARVISAYAETAGRQKLATALFAQLSPSRLDFFLHLAGESIFHAPPRNEYCFLRDLTASIPLVDVKRLDMVMSSMQYHNNILTDFSETLCDFLRQNPKKDPEAAAGFLGAIDGDHGREVLGGIIEALLDVSDSGYELIHDLAMNLYASKGARLDEFLESSGIISPSDRELFEELKLVAAKKIYSEMPPADQNIFILLTKKITADAISAEDYKLLEFFAGDEIAAFIPESESLPGSILSLLKLYSACERTDPRGGLTGISPENYHLLSGHLLKMSDEERETMCRVITGGSPISATNGKMIKFVSADQDSWIFYISEFARFSNAKLVITNNGKPPLPPTGGNRPEPLQG